MSETNSMKQSFQNNRSNVDRELVENRRNMKLLHEKFLKSQYEKSMLLNLQNKQQQLLKKKQQYEQIQKTNDYLLTEREKKKKQRYHQKQILVNDYENMIKQRKRREIQEREKRILEQNMITDHMNYLLINQRLREKKKAQQFKQEAQKQILQKMKKNENEKKLRLSQEKKHQESIEDRIKREKYQEENARLYYKRFNDVQNNRLKQFLKLPDDSLTSQVKEIDNLKNSAIKEDDQFNKQRQFDDFHSYRDYLKRLESNKYKLGLDLQLKQKEHKKTYQKIGRSEQADKQFQKMMIDSAMKYNPITNPIPYNIRNPNILKQLQVIIP